MWQLRAMTIRGLTFPDLGLVSYSITAGIKLSKVTAAAIGTANPTASAISR